MTGPARGGHSAWWATRIALARAGAKAIRLTSRLEAAAVRDLDGLVVGGGSHVDPALYSQDRLPNYQRYDEARDRFEMGMLEGADARGTPLLAICRGMQLLNVSRGGTLNQEAFSEVAGDTSNSVRARFVAEVSPNSLLFQTLGTETLRVNRLHRQSVAQLGKGLRSSATGHGGVVQGIERCEGGPFLLGVQWHPEYLPHHFSHQRLFHALARAARRASHPISA